MQWSRGLGLCARAGRGIDEGVVEPDEGVGRLVADAERDKGDIFVERPLTLMIGWVPCALNSSCEGRC